MDIRNGRGSAAQALIVGLLLGALFGGCATQDASVTRNEAFIDYWPAPKATNDLRLAVKDLIDLQGVVTTAGSEYFEKHGAPAKRDAACLAIARQRGVRIVGKTNLDELAVGVTGINEYFGIPRNRMSRWRHLIPGGSSSGDAVAIQSGMADVAFGTDTGGSVRVPAACCGIVGLKTTFGLISLQGIFPVEPKYLDTVGPMGKDIDHVVDGMDLLVNGFRERYESVRANMSGRKIRIGRLYVPGTDPKIDQAIDAALTQAQFEIVPLSSGFKAKWDQAEGEAISLAEAGAWLHDNKYLLEPEVGGKVKAAIALGEVEYLTNYQNTLRRQLAWRRTVRQVFTQVDFIALPTLKKLPPSVPIIGGSPIFEELVIGIENTAAVDYAGSPALAMPVPVNDKDIPVTSLQLIGPRFSEARLLSAGHLVEEAVGPAVEKAMAAKSGHRYDTGFQLGAKKRNQIPKPL